MAKDQPKPKPKKHTRAYMEIDEARRKTTRATTARMEQLAQSALNAIDEVLHSDEARGSEKVAAANVVLRWAGMFADSGEEPVTDIRVTVVREEHGVKA